MTRAAIVRGATGEVVGLREAETLDPLDTGFSYFAIPAGVDPLGKRIVNGTLVTVEPPIDELRMRRWTQAKAYRAIRMAGGCATAKGRVQTDQDSRDAIADALEEAAEKSLAVPAWSIEWTMESDAAVVHSAAEIKAMASAVRKHRFDCHKASRAIRKRIDATTTAAALAAIDITAGYPS